MRQNIHWSLH